MSEFGYSTRQGNEPERHNRQRKEENDGIPSGKDGQPKTVTGAEPLAELLSARRISGRQRRASLDEYKEAVHAHVKD